MQELRFVGLSEDGESLVLADETRTRYLLKPTDELRHAIRRDRRQNADGTSSPDTAAQLRPRDVQGLIRGGVPLEEIAERAGWPLEKVQRYEGPIRAERDYVSELAQAVVLPTRQESTTLRERADRRLADRGVEAERVVWDSWKADDTYWHVVVRFPAGGRLREATWQFDPINRILRTMDDEARWLGGDELGTAEPQDSPTKPTAKSTTPSRPHRDVNVYDVEAEGGLADAQAPHLGAAARQSDAPAQMADALRARQANRSKQKMRSSSPSGSADPTSTPSMNAESEQVERLNLSSPPPQGSRPTPSFEVVSSSATEQSTSEQSPSEQDDFAGGQNASEEQTSPARSKSSKKSRGRASKRGARHISAAPVRSALLRDDEENDEELFEQLPGYHDGSGFYDDADASDESAEAPQGREFTDISADADADDTNDAADSANDAGDDNDDRGQERRGDTSANASASDDADASDERDDDAGHNAADNQAPESSAPAASPSSEASGNKGKKKSPSPKDVPSRPSSSRRSGRPSVPSWDDIMFGGGRKK